MRNIWTIAKREYDLYFISPVAYVVAFLFLTIVGLIFGINIIALTLNQFGYAPAPDPRIVTAEEKRTVRIPRVTDGRCGACWRS